MTTEQIKDYLKKYRIDSEEQLAKHIEELKRNTIPNNEIIFPLVDLLLNEKSVLNSFFRENSKERGETAYVGTVTPFFLDEMLGKCSTQCFCDGSCKKPQQKNLGGYKIPNVKVNATRHKAREEGRYHPYPLTSEKDDVITSSNRGEKETMEYLQGVKESQSVDKAPIFTYCKVNKNALEALAFRALYGHKKYNKNGEDEDWQNFTRVPNAEEEYANAEFRHALEIGGEETTEEHLIASAWNAVSRLEIFLRKKVKMNLQD